MKRMVAIALIAGAPWACKARKDQDSRVLQDGPPAASDSQESIAGLDRLLDNLEADLDAIEAMYAGELRRLPEGDGYALVDRPPEVQEIDQMVEQLRALSRDRVLQDRGRVETIIVELETLSQLLNDQLTTEEKTRIVRALARVRAFLEEPPTPPPPPPVTDQSPISCVQGSDGWYRPTVMPNGIALGRGFESAALCERSRVFSKNGLVCSYNGSGYIPYRIARQSPVGPATPFAQPVNCFNAVNASTTFVCVVDNGNGGKFARYSLETLSPIDWWFDDHDKCRRGEKGPDPRTVCLNNCRSRENTCNQTSANNSDRIQCAIQYWDCVRPCG